MTKCDRCKAERSWRDIPTNQYIKFDGFDGTPKQIYLCPDEWSEYHGWVKETDKKNMTRKDRQNLGHYVKDGSLRCHPLDENQRDFLVSWTLNEVKYLPREKKQEVA